MGNGQKLLDSRKYFILWCDVLLKVDIFINTYSFFFLTSGIQLVCFIMLMIVSIKKKTSIDIGQTTQSILGSNIIK